MEIISLTQNGEIRWNYDNEQPLTQFNEEVPFPFLSNFWLATLESLFTFLSYFEREVFVFSLLPFEIVSILSTLWSLLTLGAMVAIFVDDVESRLLNTELVLLAIDRRCSSMICLTYNSGSEAVADDMLRGRRTATGFPTIGSCSTPALKRK